MHRKKGVFVFVGRLKFDVTPCLQCVTLYEVTNPNFYEGVLFLFFAKLSSMLNLRLVFHNVSMECINWTTKNCFYARVVFFTLQGRAEHFILYKKKQEIMN